MLVTTKIKDIHELAAELASVRRGRTVVQCHGVFDLLHIGHIRHFQEARKSGEMLIVTVTPDRYVNKGPHRPVFTELLRAEAIAALDGVDYVAINKWPTAVEAIQLLRPDVYAKGSDYANASTDITGGISLERSAIEDIGGKLVFTDEIRFSSSALLNQHMSIFSDEVNDYLTKFRRMYSTADVTGFIDRARGVRALVVGDAIIDDYQYCETLGKSGKEPILAAQFVRSEKFVGGALAVANHIASCCPDVRLVTMLGSDDSHEAFIRASLAPGVVPEFLTMAGAPTLIKRRFIETYPFQKLFEVYVMNEQAARGGLSQRPDSRCERSTASAPGTPCSRSGRCAPPLAPQSKSSGSSATPWVQRPSASSATSGSSNGRRSSSTSRRCSSNEAS